MSGDPTPFADAEEAARAGRQSGKTERREVTCPKCGGEFANLPQHLRACDGEAVTDGGRIHDAVDGGFVCDKCETIRQTPLGMARHRLLCRRREGQHGQ